jgi:uncharacterized coiled-coil protein SlyX
MNLKQMVKNVKNYVKMASKGEAFIELFDVEDNSVIFEVPTIDDIKVGVPASPDGEFIFSDGMKIVISGGVVTEMVKPTTEEVVVETETETEGKAKGEEEIPADEKDKKIVELEQMVSDLKSQLEELKKNVVEKDSTIEEAEKELEEIKNFYVDLNKSSIAGRKGNEEGVVFSFKKSKK